MRAQSGGVAVVTMCAFVHLAVATVVLSMLWPQVIWIWATRMRGLTIAVVLAGLVYVYFVRAGSARDMIERYQSETYQERARRNILAGAFFFGSIIVAFGAGMILAALQGGS